MEEAETGEADFTFVQDEDGSWGKYQIPAGMSLRTGVKRQDLIPLGRYKEYVVEPTAAAVAAIPDNVEMCYDPHRINFVWLMPDDAETER